LEAIGPTGLTREVQAQAFIADRETSLLMSPDIARALGLHVLIDLEAFYSGFRQTTSGQLLALDQCERPLVSIRLQSDAGTALSRTLQPTIVCDLEVPLMLGMAWEPPPGERWTEPRHQTGQYEAPQWGDSGRRHPPPQPGQWARPYKFAETGPSMPAWPRPVSFSSGAAQSRRQRDARLDTRLEPLTCPELHPEYHRAFTVLGCLQGPGDASGLAGTVDVDWEADTHFISAGLARLLGGAVPPPATELVGLIGASRRQPGARMVQQERQYGEAPEYLTCPLFSGLRLDLQLERNSWAPFSGTFTVLPDEYFDGRSLVILADGPWFDLPEIGPPRPPSPAWQPASPYRRLAGAREHVTDWSRLCAASQPRRHFWEALRDSEPPWLRAAIGPIDLPAFERPTDSIDYREYLLAGGPAWGGGDGGPHPPMFGLGAPLLVPSPAPAPADPHAARGAAWWGGAAAP